MCVDTAGGSNTLLFGRATIWRRGLRCSKGSEGGKTVNVSGGGFYLFCMLYVTLEGASNLDLPGTETAWSNNNHDGYLRHQHLFHSIGWLSLYDPSTGRAQRLVIFSPVPGTHCSFFLAEEFSPTPPAISVAATICSGQSTQGKLFIAVLLCQNRLYLCVWILRTYHR